MSMRIASRQVFDELDLPFRDWPHCHHDRSVKAASGTTGNVRDKHQNGGIALDIAHGDTRLDQGMVEGMAAAEQEGHQVISPKVAYLLSLLNQLPIAVDTVTADVGSKIGSWCRAGRLRITWWGDLDQRAGFGIASTESGELRGGFLGKDNQICLLICRAVP